MINYYLITLWEIYIISCLLLWKLAVYHYLALQNGCGLYIIISFGHFFWICTMLIMWPCGLFWRNCMLTFKSHLWFKIVKLKLCFFYNQIDAFFLTIPLAVNIGLLLQGQLLVAIDFVFRHQDCLFDIMILSSVSKAYCVILL